MATLRTNNWPSLIQDCVNQLNSRPLQRLHGLAPKDFNSPLDDVKLEGLKEPSDDDAEKFKANQESYEKDSSQFQVSDMVYADKKPTSTFAKSFNPKVPMKFSKHELGSFHSLSNISLLHNLLSNLRQVKCEFFGQYKMFNVNRKFSLLKKLVLRFPIVSATFPIKKLLLSQKTLLPQF